MDSSESKIIGSLLCMFLNGLLFNLKVTTTNSCQAILCKVIFSSTVRKSSASPCDVMATPKASPALRAEELLTPEVLEKVISWESFRLRYMMFCEAQTQSSEERFIRPLHRRLMYRIEQAEFAAFSPGGQVPEIFHRSARDREENGPLGAYFHVRDVFTTAKLCGFETTIEASTAYRGGDLYTPLCTVLRDSKDYSADVNVSLLRFNHQPMTDIWSRDLSKAYGPTTLDFWIPSAILY